MAWKPKSVAIDILNVKLFARLAISNRVWTARQLRAPGAATPKWADFKPIGPRKTSPKGGRGLTGPDCSDWSLPGKSWIRPTS